MRTYIRLLIINPSLSADLAERLYETDKMALIFSSLDYARLLKHRKQRVEVKYIQTASSREK